MGIPHTHIGNNDIMFNEDHVKLTLNGLPGAKNIQAINTLIEIYADLIGALKSNHDYELEKFKIESYKEIGNGFLTKINGQELKDYFNSTFKFHVSGQDERHDDCCLYLLDKAHSMIKESLAMSDIESTAQIQAVNYMVKNEWIYKALQMTNDKKISTKKLWDSIENKSIDESITKINLDGGLNL